MAPMTLFEPYHYEVYNYSYCNVKLSTRLLNEHKCEINNLSFFYLKHNLYI
jgi:hypothetical protein